MSYQYLMILHCEIKNTTAAPLYTGMYKRPLDELGSRFSWRWKDERVQTNTERLFSTASFQSTTFVACAPRPPDYEGNRLGISSHGWTVVNCITGMLILYAPCTVPCTPCCPCLVSVSGMYLANAKQRGKPWTPLTMSAIVLLLIQETTSCTENEWHLFEKKQLKKSHYSSTLRTLRTAAYTQNI